MGKSLKNAFTEKLGNVIRDNSVKKIKQKGIGEVGKLSKFK